MDETPEVLLDNEFIRVESHPARRVIAVRRKAPKLDPSMVGPAYGEALSFITPEHQSWGVLVDLRETPGTNDHSFEAATRPLSDRIVASFARVVFLVRTAVGGLQMERLRRERGVDLLYTRDEDEAFALASGELH